MDQYTHSNPVQAAAEPPSGSATFSFGDELLAKTKLAAKFGEALTLHRSRLRALRNGDWKPSGLELRIAVVGGATLRPFADLLEHFVSVFCNVAAVVWTGDYDNYVSEILDPESELYAFGPEIVLLMPAEQRCRLTCPINAPLDVQEAEANTIVDGILSLCQTAHDRSKAEIVVANFRMPSTFDPGPLRQSSLIFPYGLRKFVNMQLARKLKSYTHLLDVEFLANRLGTVAAADPRTWFESKQPYSAALVLEAAREFASAVSALKKPPKKVVVLDLDNTLWGGVIGDDGLEGIEIGSTSPRGEAFRAFQEYLLSLSRRGILLAVCSKNDHEKAVEPFLKHPEMVLRLTDIASFKANWNPKSENIRQIAADLNLGLDSFVFVDDNPAEIEIVRQFVPEVAVVWVGDDPSDFVSILDGGRHFEVRSITGEDVKRAAQYRQEIERQVLMESATDMESYLTSLGMVAHITEFTAIDAPRISQLINKSNQFNLTTRRRTEAEVLEVLDSPVHRTFTIRLSDKFGDHGLIAVVIGEVKGSDFEVDTWLMSCRVLKRQVEEETLNEVFRLAGLAGCERVVGVYRPTEKNGMVRDHYCALGFSPLHESEGGQYFTLGVPEFVQRPTKIEVATRSYGTE